MHWILLFAFLAACHAAITTETLTDEILSSNPSLFQEESSQDLSWIDPETLILSNEYDVSGGDFLTLQDLSSSTTGLASPPCLVNEGDQLPSRKTRVRRDRGTAGSSCDATSNKPWHPPEQINQPGKFDEKLWKEIMGIPGRNQPQPEGPPTLFPILKDPKDDDQNCLPGFPKHLCCAELGPLESFDQLPMIYVRMFQCEIGLENIPCQVAYDACCQEMYQDARSLSPLLTLINPLYVGSRCYQRALTLDPQPRTGL